ncbi:developmental protein-like protein fluG [Massariosphaeria phaeospora]|uniref:Glutamine synthetase n=1 Tax=Massariosphaeria phaeospora TaxID=100035 RepID=A0A7C8IE80_9PLEO|nr:developmental protein-like protein fluG [Massariosphaeria phaeospora]
MDLPAPLLKPAMEQVRHVVNNFPIIDNHAHNLILPTHLDTVPFESITSEAQGRALRDTFKSLPHIRASRQLRQLFELSDDANWEDVLQQRIEWLRSDPERLNAKCFEGVYSLLIDDGLAGPEKVHPYEWHDHLTKAPTKRIVRIETVAESIVEEILRDARDSDLDDPNYLTDTWIQFTDTFEREIQEAVQDSRVAGFKTVICYRSGLDIEPDYTIAAREVGHPFERYIERATRKRKFRIERKALNDYLVLRTLEILSEQLPHQPAFSKPLQLHTGLGDNDISLLQSNPAYLQPLIENYASVPFVLLHSAYPYTREAGYLATVYKHVYLDVGEVFPTVSRDGQKTILRQSLELVPGSKLLYSSDGHWFPETYWLANKQFREVWLDLLTEYVQKEDVTAHQAIAMTKDILFNNANTLYSLGYHVDFVDLPDNPQNTIAYHTKSESQSPYQPPPFPPPSRSGDYDPATIFLPQSPPVAVETNSPYQVPLFPPPPIVPRVYDEQVFDAFMQQNPDVKFVYVQWLDYMATIRCRILPIKQFDRLIRSGDRIGISRGNIGTLQNDGITPVVNPVGQIYVEPDLRSLRRTHDKNDPSSATVFSFWRDEAGYPIPECPRTNLETLVNELQYNHGISLLCGFEIEVTFLTRNTDPLTSKDEPYKPITTTHAWGTLTPEQWMQVPMLTQIATSLDTMGIELQQFHAESGAGQYEFVLAPLPPLLAIDALIQARQAIAQIAALHNLRATLHPSPFPGTGTGAHTHISLNPPDHDMQFFVGGVLRHLPALCAFTMPAADSYARVVDDRWSGGTWVAWGTQNREAPLRRVGPGRWELRCVDGLANMYIAVAAVLAAGLLGLARNEAEFTEKDLHVNPAKLSEGDRAVLGVRERMPRGVEEALQRLGEDGELVERLGGGFVGDWVKMKGWEGEMLGKMGEAEKRAWMVERY